MHKGPYTEYKLQGILETAKTFTKLTTIKF